MLESIVSKIANTVRAAVHAAGVATHKSPWLMPALILTLFLVW
jgi:hypothetical protein